MAHDYGAMKIHLPTPVATIIIATPDPQPSSLAIRTTIPTLAPRGYFPTLPHCPHYRSIRLDDVLWGGPHL